MSLCSPCTRLKNVALCTDTLTIGTVGSNSTLYNIYFRSLSNAMRVKNTAISRIAGLLK